MASIHFESKLSKIGEMTILKLPKETSAKLPSRGLVMVKGTINDKPFQSALEPDGKKSHWFLITAEMSKEIKAKAGDSVKLAIEPTKDWPEPEIPNDLKKALATNTLASKTWKDITPMSRWDWIRWIRSTNNPETRALRIEKTFSKFKSGKRSPCCFNRSACTVMEVSNRGVLLEA
jgi:hypothetical protein